MFVLKITVQKTKIMKKKTLTAITMLARLKLSSEFKLRLYDFNQLTLFDLQYKL